MLRLVSLSKQYGSKILFDSVALHIKPGERVGLVGANGTGKTTLLRMLAGEENPDSGEIILRKNARLGYLKQDITEDATQSVLETVLQGFPEVARIENKLLRLQQQISEQPDNKQLLTEYGRLQEEFERLDGYSLESRARAILTGIGFAPESHTRPVRSFSGGWMMRIALARLLVQEPDILLLDEPTNHLDLMSLIWLENFLISSPATLILVSHDQYFLNRIATHIVEVRSRKLYSYTGNFDDYVRERAQQFARLEAEYRAQQKEIEKTERFIERFRYKATKARQVQSRVKQLEKMERVELPEETTQVMRLKLPQPKRTGKLVMQLKDVTKRYGEQTVYENLNFTVSRGQKIALVGHNGAGKSTLLKILAGVTEIQQGERLPGEHVQVEYYAQHQLDILDPEKEILQELAGAAPTQSEVNLRKIAGAFLFSGDDVHKKIAVLSGGERARVALARMLLRGGNFLIFDEPTNHLDMQAREVLKETLSHYDGTMIFISHDRDFIDAVANLVIEIDRGRLREYPGNYAYYQWKKEQEKEREAPESTPGAAAKKPTPAPSKSRKESRKRRAEKQQERARVLGPLQRRQADIESEIQALEEEKETLTADLCRPDIIADKELFPQKNKRLHEVEKHLSSLYDAWESLAMEIEEKSEELEEKFADLPE